MKNVEMDKTYKNDVYWLPKIFLAVVMLCLPSLGEGFFVHGTSSSFWDTNLVATVIGYTKDRAFMGTHIPEMVPSGQAAQQVWFKCIAPTNFERVVFSMHKCGPASLLSIYPTNQFFVFPASFRGNSSFRDPVMISERHNSATSFQTIHDYCPACTIDKVFPITENQSQYWELFIRSNLEVWTKRNAEWRDKMKNESDDKKRASLSNRVEHAERKIKSLQLEIDDCKKQPQYFKERIEWLKTQGVNPEDQKTDN
jgi:hypothetical protein